MTLNAAISLRAHAAIEQRNDGRIEIKSIDTGRQCRAPHWSEIPSADGLSLLALLARHYRLENATLTTRGESPAGAGIAGSSALAIAACGALARWTGSSSEADDLLRVAMNVECQAIRVPTGVQDYRRAHRPGQHDLTCGEVLAVAGQRVREPCNGRGRMAEDGRASTRPL